MFAVYGTSTHGPRALAQLISERLGVAFSERDSYFRGTYLTAQAGQARIEVQSNAIPGDGDQTDLYADDYPDVSVLVLCAGADLDHSLNTTLESIAGLAPLEHA